MAKMLIHHLIIRYYSHEMLRTTLDNDRDGEGGASSEGDEAFTAPRNDWTNSHNQMVVTQIIGKQKCVKVLFVY